MKIMDIGPKNIRLHFLDGLRGWASLVVLLSHLIQCWLASCLPEAGETFYLSYVRYSPLFLLMDGTVAVYLFFIISAIALSYKFFMDHDNKSIIKMAQFRYFRLAIPIFFSTLFAYTLLSFGLMHHYDIGFPWFEAMYNFEPNFINIFTDSFFNSFFFFNPASSYNLVLWTMSVEFIGSLFIFYFLCFFGSSRSRFFIYILLSYLFFESCFSLNYLPFLFGLMISDIYCLLQKKGFKKAYFLFTCCCLGLFVLFYYQYVALKISSYLDNFEKPAGIISAALLMITILSSPFLQKILSCRVSHFMGKISFPLYLLQLPIICSFSCYLYLKLFSIGMSTTAIFILVIFQTIFVCVICSYVFSIYIEEKLLKKFKFFFFSSLNKENKLAFTPVANLTPLKCLAFLACLKSR